MKTSEDEQLKDSIWCCPHCGTNHEGAPAKCAECGYDRHHRPPGSLMCDRDGCESSADYRAIVAGGGGPVNICAKHASEGNKQGDWVPGCGYPVPLCRCGVVIQTAGWWGCDACVGRNRQEGLCRRD